MKAIDVPAKFNIPFANSAGGSFIRAIPEASQIGIQDGAASLTTGFVPDNFVPTGAGGVPPFGADMNGILKQSTSWDRWFSAGGPLKWDSAFSAAISGYPAGAVVASTVTLALFWLSLVDDNATNPDAGGAGWLAVNFQSSPNGQCYFGWLNSTQARLSPKDGNCLRVNGVPRLVPSAGITLIVGNCYVGGVAAQALAINTDYNVYAFDVAGTLVLDCWTGAGSGHVADTTVGNLGVEVRNASGTPDSTRTLVGKVRLNPSGLLVANGGGVISWFNKLDLTQTNSQTAGLNQISTTTDAEVAASLRIGFLSWGLDAVEDYIAGSGSMNTAGGVTSLFNALDANGGDVGIHGGVYAVSIPQLLVPCAFYKKVVAEGFHFMAAMGNVSGAGQVMTYIGVSHSLTVKG